MQCFCAWTSSVVLFTLFCGAIVTIESYLPHGVQCRLVLFFLVAVFFNIVIILVFVAIVIIFRFLIATCKLFFDEFTPEVRRYRFIQHTSSDWVVDD